jgi:hypothetical protein
MPEQLLFEYAIVRVVPRVEREEFLNVGVVLYCASRKFLKVRFELNKPRIIAFACKLDIAEIEEYLLAFERICNADVKGGAIGKLPPADRFRWLTATRSTVVQTSRVHPGLCSDPNEMLDRMYAQMVLQ